MSTTPLGSRWNQMLNSGTQLGIYQADVHGILLPETVYKNGKWIEGNAFYASDSEQTLIQRMQLYERYIQQYAQMASKIVGTEEQNRHFIQGTWLEFRHSLYEKLYELKHDTKTYATFLSPKQIEQYVNQHTNLENYFSFLFEDELASYESKQVEHSAHLYPHRELFHHTWEDVGESFFELLEEKQLPFHMIHAWINTCDDVISAFVNDETGEDLSEQMLLATMADAFMTVLLEAVSDENEEITQDCTALFALAIDRCNWRAIGEVVMHYQESHHGLVELYMQAFSSHFAPMKTNFKAIENPKNSVKPMKRKKQG